MHINDSSLLLTASHQLESTSTRQILLGQTDDDPARSFDALLARLGVEPEQPTVLTAPPTQSSAQQEKLEKVLQNILMMLLGRDSGDPGPMPFEAAYDLPQAGRPLAVEMTRTRETERCSFSASGNICLADGSTRSFDVGYEMERSEESSHVSMGKLRDPLVLDRAAPTNRLAEERVAFDLDSDGQLEAMRMPSSGSAFLFHDLNGNGKADDGKELFGPTSGNGFAELAALDSDGNQWIDAGDAAWSELMLWGIGEDGNSQYQSLAATGIGALSTHYEETPFTIKEDGETVGQVCGSSVWLGEESGAGIVRQIDIATA